MKKVCYCCFLLIFTISVINAEESKKMEPISLFGSKPIQLELTKEGIKKRDKGGFNCELDASLGGGHFSEWGETMDNAQSIVYKKCSDKAGLILCKKEKAICKQEY